MVLELAVGDRETYFRYMRMTPDRKEHLFLWALLTKLSYQLIVESSFPLNSGFRSRRAILLQENLKSPLVCNTTLDDKQLQKKIPETYKVIYDELVAKYVDTLSSQKDGLAI